MNTPMLIHASARYFRAHGLGNDYLVFEAAPPAAPEGAAPGAPPDSTGSWPLSPPAIRLVCNRWEGVGSDGIIVLLRRSPGEGQPFPLRMFNPDGSEFERSGNGLRILASFLAREGLVSEGGPFIVQSGGSLIPMEFLGMDGDGTYDVSVEMGQARLGAEAVELESPSVRIAGHRCSLPDPEGGELAFVPVSVGNPHAVVFSEDLSEKALARLGPLLSQNPAFRRGTNVQIARPLDRTSLEIRIWERGVGRTSASGTSSCAAAVAGVALGLLQPGALEVRMPGGRLQVEVSSSLAVVLRGPVQHICDGVLAPGFMHLLGAPD